MSEHGMKKLLFFMGSLFSILYAGALEQELEDLSLSLRKLAHDLGSPTVTADQKIQLVTVLSDLGMESELEDVEKDEQVTVSDFLKDLKHAIQEILKGFDPITYTYIGYPNNKKRFFKLKDFDVAIKMLKAAAPEDPDLPKFEGWRPHLLNAEGKLPETVSKP